jgi:hypothetical protein
MSTPESQGTEAPEPLTRGASPTVKTPWRRAIFISILSGAAGFGLLIAFAEVLWRLYPYPEGASQGQIRFVWAIHVLSEKVFGFLILAVCAVGAAIPFRNKWRIGFGAAIGSGIVYQAIAVFVYILRFGFAPYLENNRFW